LFPVLFGVIRDPKLGISLWNLFHVYHNKDLDKISVEQKIIYEWTKDKMESSK
jgi:hypothetical protein